MKPDFILILDFGSQYTQLIARRIREMSVYCEIQPYFIEVVDYLKDKSDFTLKGVIFSGGPSSVKSKDSPKISKSLIELFVADKIPVLGICYGMQYLTEVFSGKVKHVGSGEYGFSSLNIIKKSELFKGCGKKLNVWMSHGDSVFKVAPGFVVTSLSSGGIIGSIEKRRDKLFGVQFHPEVAHTEKGKNILNNFLFGICGIKNLYKPQSFIKKKISEIRESVGNNPVVCGLSGGVDSSVAAVLVHKAIGDNLYCIHIDNGLMRKNESRNIVKLFREKLGYKLIFVNASDLFLKRLRNVNDPEMKRKIIGKTFIDVFEKEARKINVNGKKVKFLVQGTLYPDLIESVSFKGPSAVIKSHHNVGGLPENMKLNLIEPLKELFKDEVRIVGKKLGLDKKFLDRHPFPGPGLAVRVIGYLTRQSIKILQEVDDIFIDEIVKHNLYNKIWQAFAVLLPVKSVGVMGDNRSYENVIALRAVTSVDGMTADFYHFDKDFLTKVSNKIINSVKGVNRVVYDISSKPPATIEWE